MHNEVHIQQRCLASEKIRGLHVCIMRQDRTKHCQCCPHHRQNEAPAHLTLVTIVHTGSAPAMFPDELGIESQRINEKTGNHHQH